MWLKWETLTHHAWRPRITRGADASSRRLQPETHTTKIRWKSMQSPGKGMAKKNPSRARWVARKENKATQAKVTERRQQNPRDSTVTVETLESMDTKLLLVCTSHLPNLKAKARVRESRNPNFQKSVKVTAVTQVEKTWTSNTSTPQTSLRQVNTIVCADEGLWISSLEERKKRRYTVNWEDQSVWNTEEHELMIDSGCFGPWSTPQFPMVSCTNVEAVRTW